MHFTHAGARYNGYTRTQDSRERASSLRTGLTSAERPAPQQRFRAFSVDSSSSDTFGSPMSHAAPTDGSVVAVDCTKDAAAKSWSSSKIRYSWQLIVDGRQHVIVFTNSRSSGKKRVFVDGNLQTEQKTFRANQFQYRWHIGRHLCAIAPDSDGFFGQVDCAFELRIDGRPFDQYKQRGGRPQPFRPQQQQQQFRPPPPAHVGRPPAQTQRRRDDSDDEELKRALAMSAAEERDRQAKLRGTGGASNTTQSTKRSVELAREAQRAAAHSQAEPPGKKPLQAGQRMRVVGLVNSAELNGTYCTLQNYNPESGRWTARLESDGICRNFKPANFEHVEVGATTTAARQPAQSASTTVDMEADLMEQMEQAAILASLEESRMSQSNDRSETTPLREDAFQQSTDPSWSAWGEEVPQEKKKKKKSKEVADPWSAADAFGARNSAPAVISTSAFGSVSGGFVDNDSKSPTDAWPDSNETSGWPPPPASGTCSARGSFSSVDSFKVEDSFLSQSSYGGSPAETMNSGFGSWEALDQQKDDAPNPWAGCDSPMSVQSAPVFSQTVLAPVVEPLNPWGDIASQTTPKSAPSQSQALGSDPWGMHVATKLEAEPQPSGFSATASAGETPQADSWPSSSSTQGADVWLSPSSAQHVQPSAHFTPVDAETSPHFTPVDPVDPWSGATDKSPSPSTAPDTLTAQQSVASPWPPVQPASASPAPWPRRQSSESITSPWPAPAVAEAWPPVAAASSPVQSSPAPWPNVKDQALGAPANPFSSSEWPPAASASSPTPWP